MKNNLAYSPNTINLAPVLIANSGSCVISGAAGTFGNSSDSQIRLSPMFAGATPVNPVDFIIGTGSYAHGIATTLPVYSDFFRKRRTSGSAWDSGATLTQ